MTAPLSIDNVAVSIVGNALKFQWLFFDHLKRGTTFRTLYLREKIGFVFRYLYSRVAFRTGCFGHSYLQRDTLFLPLLLCPFLLGTLFLRHCTSTPFPAGPQTKTAA